MTRDAVYVCMYVCVYIFMLYSMCVYYVGDDRAYVSVSVQSKLGLVCGGVKYPLHTENERRQ